jgi:acyl carrier protein
MTQQSLHRQIAEAVVAACDDEISLQAVLAEQNSLMALGVTSLAYMRLIELMESQYGVYIDLDAEMPDTVADFAQRLSDAGVSADD